MLVGTFQLLVDGHDSLTLYHQLSRVRRASCGVASRARVRPRVTVLNRLDEQDVGTVTDRLGGQLAVHGDVPPVERPPHRHGRVAFIGVTRQVHLVASSQGIRRGEREDLRRLWNMHRRSAVKSPRQSPRVEHCT